jgi:hypothetical protein
MWPNVMLSDLPSKVKRPVMGLSTSRLKVEPSLVSVGAIEVDPASTPKSPLVTFKSSYRQLKSPNGTDEPASMLNASLPAASRKPMIANGKPVIV